jgi:hypothetical protein
MNLHFIKIAYFFSQTHHLDSISQVSLQERNINLGRKKINRNTINHLGFRLNTGTLQPRNLNGLPYPWPDIRLPMKIHDSPYPQAKSLELITLLHLVRYRLHSSQPERYVAKPVSTMKS